MPPRKRSPHSSGGHTPATYWWWQGFATIRSGGREVVPFVSRMTALRVARQAEENTKIPMKVIQIPEGWGYHPAPMRKAA